MMSHGVNASPMSPGLKGLYTADERQPKHDHQRPLGHRTLLRSPAAIGLPGVPDRGAVPDSAGVVGGVGNFFLPGFPEAAKALDAESSRTGLHAWSDSAADRARATGAPIRGKRSCGDDLEDSAHAQW